MGSQAVKWLWSQDFPMSQSEKQLGDRHAVVRLQERQTKKQYRVAQKFEMLH
jgi:hypothetical protein